MLKLSLALLLNKLCILLTERFGLLIGLERKPVRRIRFIESDLLCLFDEFRLLPLGLGCFTSRCFLSIEALLKLSLPLLCGDKCRELNLEILSALFGL